MDDKVILVTGATGYIGSHVVKILLEKGYRVRGTVRSLKNPERHAPLRSLVPNPKYPLELVEVDLTKDEGWDNAMADCKVLMHLASPFPNVIGGEIKEEEDLVTPAREGTLRAIRAAVAADVKKVILTSSCVSIVGTSNIDENKIYTEEDWCDPNDPTIDTYTKSKIIAERAAWDYLKTLPDEKKFDLSVINPSFVLGPVLLASNKSSTSVSFMAQILNHELPAYPKLAIYMCDVRDVAMAHLQAMLVITASGHRHIINTRTLWLRDIAVLVKKEFGPQGYCIAATQLPYFLCWVASFFHKPMRTVILPRYGKTVNLSNRRMIEVLGIAPTPVDQSLSDMAYSVIEMGFVKKTKKYKGAGHK